jgi:serine protease Do
MLADNTHQQGSATVNEPGPVPRSRFDAVLGSNRISGLTTRVIAIGLIAGIIGGSLGSYGFIKYFASSVPTAKQELVVNETSGVVDVAKQVSPSVVSITTKQLGQGFYGQTQQVEGAGTGIIVSADGLILTNKHVVPDGTSTVTVVDANGKQYTDGQVVSRDPVNDIAFIRIKASGLHAAQLGDSSNVKVGEKVVAIGNALGQFQNSVTEGIISGVSREIAAGDQSGSASEVLQNVFQTDAAINPGNSGGPLVNLVGQVIGMNTAVASQNAQNIGFAIPINDIKNDISSVMTQGKIVRPYLGVRFVSITNDVASSNNLSVNNGAWLQSDQSGPSVVAGSPAAKAGLKDGDIITKVDGTLIDPTHSLQTLVSNHKVGDKVDLTVIRDGKTIDVTVNLEEAPAGS